MKVISVGGCPYEDYDGQILNLRIKLDEGEEICLNDTVSIEMMDDTYLEKEVLIINPRLAGDYQVISEKTKEKVQSGEYGASEKPTKKITGPCISDIVVKDVPYHDVKTDEEINARKMLEEIRKKVCLSPFKELCAGEESIYDYVVDGYTVPDKVIAYLQTTKPFMMCPGIYKHPFKPEKELLGPYFYTDGNYYWDRDLWKYVVKYHVTLPEEFVEYITSGAGDAFLEAFYNNPKSWSDTIKKWKNQGSGICLLPDNAGDNELSDF